MVKDDSTLGGATSNTNEETDYKHITNRIDRIQKHCDDLAKVLAGYATKSAIMRDKNDEIAKCLAKYTKIEDFNTTSKLAMTIAAELFAKVGDHQTMAVQRLETKVLPNFCSYGKICKCLKGDVRNATAAQERVLSRRKLATAFSERMNEPKYRDVITDAERDLENAMAESSRLGMLSQEQVIKFEHKRLIDLKETLESFFKIEITRHAKSLELLTEAYKYIHSIDEDADLEALKGGLKLREIQPISEQKFKSLKNKGNMENKPEEDKSWNSDLVRKFDNIMNSPSALRRPVTKIMKTSQKKDSSVHNIKSRKESLIKSAKTNANTLIPESNLSRSENRSHENKDNKQRKEKAKRIESFSSRETFQPQQASRTPSDFDIANRNEFTKGIHTQKRPGSARHPNKLIERTASTSNISKSNYNKSRENDDYEVVKHEIEAKILNRKGENIDRMNRKKVSFHDDSRHDWDQNGKHVNEEVKQIQVLSKQGGKNYPEKKSTISSKFSPAKTVSKQQFL